MNTPASGARLLKRLVPGEDHDVLLGDLCEEYQHGRAAIWYWMQIAAAIAVSAWKQTRTRKSVVLGAIAAGFGFQIAFGNLDLLIRIASREAGHPVTRPL